jgi:arylsulfatase A-like enzyme
MKHWRDRSGLATRLGNISLVLAALGTSPLLEGCSSDPLHGGSEQIGSLGLQLEAAPGVTLNSVTYSITGNGFSKTGSIDTSGAPAISATIGGIPAGKAYLITLNATSVEDGTSFTGSASFDVKAGGTTAVTLRLRGDGSSSNGSVTVNGSINVGPFIDELTVSPLTLFVGSSVTLKGVGSDADEGPSALSYYWSTTGGSIDDPVAANATLTSDAPGTFTVKLTVSDGDSSDSATTTVTFLERDGGAGGEGGTGGEGSSERKQPNILLLLIDDLGAESTSVYPDLAGDSGAVPVPNIEALAENGLVFDNAWASPVCSPTRGTIVSGKYGYRTGVTTVGNVLPTDTVTLFDRLTSESPDYGQAVFGKYHLGGGNSRSIDPLPGSPYPEAAGVLQHVRDLGIPTFRGILAGGISDYFNFTTYDISGPDEVTTKFATSALTDYAIDYIHGHEEAHPDEPWFVYQAYNAPHAVVGGNSPFQVPPAELHSVDLSSVGDPPPGTIATNLPVYKALVQSLDTEIGRLLAEVDLDDTVVIFVGDNGTPNTAKDTGTGIRNSKGSVYEGGFRVPLIVAGAGVTRRGREDDLVVTTDLYASILGLAGGSVNQINDSYSFKPLLSDAAATNGRTHSFSEVSQGANNRSYAIKDKRYKLLYTSRRWELYDLVADPLETNNLIASEAHAAVLATLKEQVAAHRADAPPGYFPE